MSENPFTQPLRKTMNDPQFDWARPRKIRQRLVIAFLSLLLVQPFALSAAESPFVLVALLLPLVFLIGSVNASIRGISELKSNDLDEREVDSRNRVYVRLYWPGLILGVFGAFMIGLYPSLKSLILIGSGLSVFFLAMALPAITMAWLLPDEPGNE